MAAYRSRQEVDAVQLTCWTDLKPRLWPEWLKEAWCKHPRERDSLFLEPKNGGTERNLPRFCLGSGDGEWQVIPDGYYIVRTALESLRPGEARLKPGLRLFAPHVFEAAWELVQSSA